MEATIEDSPAGGGLSNNHRAANAGIAAAAVS